MVQYHPDLLDARIYRLLLWLIIGCLFVRYLNHLCLLDPAMALGNDLLTTRLERGSISMSAATCPIFPHAVGGGYRRSNFIRFMLEDDFIPGP